MEDQNKIIDKIIDVLSQKRTFDNESINLLNAHRHELIDNHYLVDNRHIPKTKHAQIVNTSLRIHAIRVSKEEHYIIDNPERFIKILKIKRQRNQLHLNKPADLETIMENAYLQVKRDLIRDVMKQNHQHHGMSMYLAKHLPYDTFKTLNFYEHHDRKIIHNESPDVVDLCKIQQVNGKSVKELTQDYVERIKNILKDNDFNKDS